ncbi:MAG: hypothetical protein WBK88_03220 [Methanothrix sp.]
MTWADRRIREYRDGEEPSVLERIALEHGHPVNFAASILALAAIGYGLWTHQWIWIGLGAALGVLGHIYCWREK